MWGSAFLWIPAGTAISPVQIALTRLALGAVVLFTVMLVRRDNVRGRCGCGHDRHRRLVRQRDPLHPFRDRRADRGLLVGRDPQRHHPAVDGDPALAIGHRTA